jgi:predicted nucleic acid-binding protein
VLVSAAIAGGPPARVLELARAGVIDLVVPDLVIEELIGILAGKLGWDRERLRAQVGLLDSIAAEAPLAPATAEPLTGDPDDDRILAGAIANGVDVIASGNRRHLLPLGERQGVRVLTPQALLAELRRRG